MSNNASRVLSLATFIFALLLIAWSILVMIVLPSDKSDYLTLVLDSQWVLVCWIGLAASLFGFIAFFGIYERIRQSAPGLSAFGYILATLGLAMEFAAKSWDTLIYPALASHPEYRGFISDGILNAEIGVTVLLAALSLFLLSGNMILGLLAIKHKIFPVWTAVCLMIATVAYIVGSLTGIPLLIAGLALYSIVFIRIGLLPYKASC